MCAMASGPCSRRPRVSDAERPLGTHASTAMEFKDDGTFDALEIVSVPASAQAASRGRFRGPRARSEPMLPRSQRAAFDAAEALARFEMPKDARDRISQMLRRAWC